jgi:hypothetical protein
MLAKMGWAIIFTNSSGHPASASKCRWLGWHFLGLEIRELKFRDGWRKQTEHLLALAGRQLKLSGRKIYSHLIDKPANLCGLLGWHGPGLPDGYIFKTKIPIWVNF